MRKIEKTGFSELFLYDTFGEDRYDRFKEYIKGYSYALAPEGDKFFFFKDVKEFCRKEKFPYEMMYVDWISMVEEELPEED